MMSVVSLVYASSPRGSGFIVYASPEAFLAMTCEHVVRGCKELQIFFPGETKPYKARVLKHDQTIDLALIRFVPDGECLGRGVPLKFVELNTPLNSGVVRMIGYHQVPEGRLLSPGVFDGKIIGEPIDDRIKCDYANEEGTSGGPVLKGDRVIGVNTSYCGARRFAVSVMGVRNTLRKWLNKGDNDIAGIDDMLAMLARE